MPTATTAQIAQRVHGELVGPGDLTITGPAELGAAVTGQLTFIGSPGYAPRWAQSGASAALVSRSIDLEPGPGRAVIRVDDADLAMASVLELFAPPPEMPEPGLHATAWVDPTAALGEGVCIGPGCVVGPGVTLGDGCVLHAQVTVMAGSRLGPGCELWPGVVVRGRCVLGARCVLQPGVVIGADGFGYRPEVTAQGVRLLKVPHIGTVELGDDVEIGANSCVDRGKFAATVIGSGTKIDNLVQVAHNCRIGRGVAISGCTGIAGSVTIDDGVVLGGRVAVRDHVTIGAGARVAGSSTVAGDVPAGAEYAGTPARPAREALRQIMALQKLPDLVKQLKRR